MVYYPRSIEPDKEERLVRRPYQIIPEIAEEILKDDQLNAHHSDLRTNLDLILQAKQILVKSNLRLVVNQAKKYQNRGISLADLIQEGNIGLMNGINRYDYRTGYRITTYVTWWINHSIGRAIADKSTTIRIPVHLRDVQSKIYSASQHLTRKLGSEPTSEEIAEQINHPAQKVKEAEKALLLNSVISLEQPIGDGNRVLRDMVTNQNEAEDYDPLARAAVSSALETELNPKEKEVIIRRFFKEQTLREVGQEYGLSRERIRQIEEKALHKLKIALK